MDQAGGSSARQWVRGSGLSVRDLLRRCGFDTRTEAGYGVVYTGKWGAPQAIPTGGGPATSVSCPTATYCPAVDDDAGVNVYNGSHWGALKFIDLKGSTFLSSVSCPTTAFCVAVDTYGYAIERSGSGWKASKEIDPANGGLTSVSCPTSTFCATVDSTGVNAVSCPGSTFCVAVDAKGRALEYKA